MYTAFKPGDEVYGKTGTRPIWPIVRFCGQMIGRRVLSLAGRHFDHVQIGVSVISRRRQAWRYPRESSGQRQ